MDYRQSLPERLGDGPVFLLALICGSVLLFIVGAVVYSQLRKRFWPTALQIAETQWLLATRTDEAATPDAQKELQFSREALAALSAEDRSIVEQVLPMTQDAGHTRDWKLYYKTHESLEWTWTFAPMMALVLWAAYRLIWQGEWGTSLWWAYLVLFVVFTLVLGVLPVVMAWTDLSARRRGDPQWHIDMSGIHVGSNLVMWPQIEEILTLEVVGIKTPPKVLVALKRRGDEDKNKQHFPNIEPGNVRLMVGDARSGSNEPQAALSLEVKLPSDTEGCASTLAALLRYRHHFARFACAVQWQDCYAAKA